MPACHGIECQGCTAGVSTATDVAEGIVTTLSARLGYKPEDCPVDPYDRKRIAVTRDEATIPVEIVPGWSGFADKYQPTYLFKIINETISEYTLGTTTKLSEGKIVIPEMSLWMYRIGMAE